MAPSSWAPARPARVTRDRSVLVPMAAGLLAVLGIWFVRRHTAYWMGDFRAYRAAGTAVLHQLPVYSATADYDVAALQFIYTPFAAVLLAPLSLLGVGVSEGVWIGVNGLLLGAVLWVSLGLAGAASGRRRTIGAAAGTLLAAPLYPVWLNVDQGQINLVILLVVLLDFSPLMPERWRGVGVGIVAGIKLTPLIFVAYFLLTGRRAAAVRSLAALAGTIVIGFLVAPSASAAYWFHGIVIDASRMIPLDWIVNHSLPGLVARLARVITPPGWALLLSAAVAVLGVAAAVLAHRRGQELVGLLVVAFTGVLVSPVTWPHHAVWVVVAFVWLATAAWRSGRVLLPWSLLVAGYVWYALGLHEHAQRPFGDGPYQWTTAGEVILLLVGYHTVILVALASVPVWLRRLAPARTPVP